MNIPKFRAWIKSENRMHDVACLDLRNENVFMVVAKDGNDMDLLAIRKLKDCILMQSTGLTDKNGVEIFFDDIVQFTYDFESGGTTYHHDGYHAVSNSDRGVFLQFLRLAWEDGAKNQEWSLSQRDLFFSERTLSYWGNNMKAMAQCVVVGNIHQHKELLNV